MLRSAFSDKLIEAGCDEAGRGSLAGPVFAAAVILPKDYRNEQLNDSKKLSAKQRYFLRKIIEKEAICWSVSSVTESMIDEINILNASFLAMHQAIAALYMLPELLLIDGNRFTTYQEIPHKCIIKGDATYLSIAAASILAKTYRDDFMMQLHKEFPIYCWDKNKGYPSRFHRETIHREGACKYHRKSYNLTGQLKFPLY